MRTNLRNLAQQANPRQALLEAAGDLNGVYVLRNQVLVATFIESEMTAGGIIKPDKTLQEARFQGKSFLVLKCGPTAFKYDGSFPYEGEAPQPGDWVIARPSDGVEMFIGPAHGSEGAPCRIFDDSSIWARVDDPSCVY